MSRRLHTWVSRLGGPTQDDTPPSREGSEDEATTTLFSTSACEATYISEEMDACSGCGEPVTQVPTERELPLSNSRT